MNNCRKKRGEMAREEHIVAEIANTQSHDQRWLCGQAEDDTECGFQERKRCGHLFDFQLQRFGVGGWGMALEAGGTAILDPFF